MRRLTALTAGILSSVLCTALVWSAPVHAQSATQIDISTLINLYDAWLQDKTNEWVNKRIEDERSDIRRLIEAEINTTIDTTVDIDQIQETELTKSQERQRSVVQALEQRLRERRIDLELLAAEEKDVYLSGTGATAATAKKEKFRTTTSYPELLAKKAVLQERIKVLESLLPLQQDRLKKLTQRQWLNQFKLLITVGIFLGILLTVMIIETLIRRRLLARISDDNKRYFISKSFTFTVYAFLILATVTILFAENPGIITSLAIVGAGIAVALQDIVKDIFGWIFIAQRRIFSLGDRITIGKHTGEIIDVGVLRFTIQEVGSAEVLEHTGKTVSIPNALILTESVINHSTTSDFVKAEMKLVITFESNRKKAEEILSRILTEETEEYAKNELRQHIRNTRMYYLSRQPVGMKIFRNIVGSGYEYTIRFSVPIGMQRSVISVLAEQIMDAFDAEPEVNLAYDTYRIIATPPGTGDGNRR